MCLSSFLTGDGCIDFSAVCTSAPWSPLSDQRPDGMTYYGASEPANTQGQRGPHHQRAL